jgi:hypothetical protein
VVVVEGALTTTDADPDPARFAPGPMIVEQVRVWDAIEPDTSREAIARVMRVEGKGLVFVSALEVDPVTRVLRGGPDAKRGEPFAEGLVSVDWRPRPLRASLATRFPSIAGVLKGLTRLRAKAAITDEALEIRGEIETLSDAAATKVQRFLEVLRDNAGEADDIQLGKMTIERTGSTVHVVWPVPAAAVLRFIDAKEEENDEDGGEGGKTGRREAQKRLVWVFASSETFPPSRLPAFLFSSHEGEARELHSGQVGGSPSPRADLRAW